MPSDIRRTSNQPYYPTSSSSSRPTSSSSSSYPTSSSSSSSQPSSSSGHYSGGYGSSYGSPRAPSGHAPLSAPMTDSQRRSQIAAYAQNNRSFYGTLVGGVNAGLQQAGIGISPSSYHSVTNNLQQVASGQMPQSQAHFTEARGFAQDARQSISDGRYTQGAVEASGVVLNTIGGVGTSFAHGSSHVHRQTTPERRGYGDW